MTSTDAAPSDATPTEEAVETSVLTALLDGEYGALRAQVKDYLVDHASFLREAETWSTEEYRERVLDMVRAAASTGLTASGFPAEYGGADDVGGNVAAFETIALGDLSVLVKFGVQFGLFGGAVHQLGTKRHHDAYLADIARAELLGSFAMTETGHGSNVQALGTTATYDDATGEFVIHTPDDSSRKDYIGNAACHARTAVVFAQLVVAGEGHGVHALVVPLRDEDGKPLPGVRIEDCGRKLGLNGVDNGRIWFDQVRVPRENLLNRYADVSEDGVYSSPIESPGRRFFTMLGTLIQGRVCVGGAGISASKVALTIATRYAAERRQFGAPDEPELLLLDYGQHQRRLLPLIARTYALNFAQARLARDFRSIFSGSGGTGPAEDQERRRRALESRAAATKALGTWHATRTIQECREACGGVGYLSVNRFAALKADTEVFTTFEGDNTILMQLVGKGRLTDLRDEFGSLDQREMLLYIGQQAVETVVEKAYMRQLVERVKDVVPGRNDPDAEGGLFDPDYHLAMLRWREDHMTSSVARRLKGGIDKGGDPADVFSRCQNHLLAAAHAHAERLVLEAFLTAISTMPEGPERTLLESVQHLHALAEIERDRAWWIEHGRLTAERSKAITRAVDHLCRDLAKHAVTLVDAFGVPEELLPQEM